MAAGALGRYKWHWVKEESEEECLTERKRVPDSRSKMKTNGDARIWTLPIPLSIVSYLSDQCPEAKERTQKKI